MIDPALQRVGAFSRSDAYSSSTFVASNKELIEHTSASRVVTGQIPIIPYTWNAKLFEFQLIYLKKKSSM